MPPIRDQIDSKFEILEELKDSLIKNISNLPQEKLKRKASPKSWNLIELTNHLLYVENYALAQLKNNLNRKTRKSFIDHSRFFVVRCVLALNVKIKVPLKEVDSSGCNNDLEKTLAEWAQCRLKLREMINNISDDALNYCYFHHPYGGKFTMNDGLLFLIDHWYHHQKQVNNLLAD